MIDLKYGSISHPRPSWHSQVDFQIDISAKNYNNQLVVKIERNIINFINSQWYFDQILVLTVRFWGNGEDNPSWVDGGALGDKYRHGSGVLDKGMVDVK